MIERIPHCCHWGAFTALVEGGRIVGIEPHPGDPAPSNLLQSIPDLMDPAVRIARPHVREGWLRSRDRTGRGRDRMIPVSWDEALDLVAGEIDRIRKAHGNDAIFAGSYGWTSAGRLHHAQSVLKRLMNCVGGYTAHVDTYSVGAGAVIARHVLGPDGYGQSNMMEMMAENTELLLVCGALSPRTAQSETGGMRGHSHALYLERLKARGGRIVLVSPRRDDIPVNLGAEWWAIRPNTDTALLLGLAGEIVAAGRHDHDFLTRCTSGAPELLGYLSGNADGVAKNAAWAAGITGLDAGAIAALAREMTTKRTFISLSFALQRAVHGEQPWWAGLALSCIAGQIGVAGGGVSYGLGSVGGVGISDPLGAVGSFPHGRKPNAAFIPVARIADMLLNPGGPFTYEGGTYAYPDIRMVYWAGGNPFHHHQDLGRLDRAWAKPETIVVQDINWSATAKRADIVLPATTTLERNDLSGGRRADWIFAMKQVVPPYAEARSDFEIMRGLASRLGVEEAFTEHRDEMGWIRHIYEETRSNAAAKGGEMPAFEDFWAVGQAAVPQKPLTPPLAQFRGDPAAHPLKSETGKILLYSKTLEACAYADCPPHPKWLEPPEWLGAPAAKAHPFHLLTAQAEGRLHSQLDNGRVAQALKQAGREALLMNPDDAKRLNLKDGDTALLSNARGRCLAGVRTTDDVRPGVAILPTGAWYQPIESADGPLEIAGNPNVLTLDVPASSFSGGCAAHTCLVSIRRYEGNAPLPAFTRPEGAEAQ
ncbi:MAG: Asp-tRNA(Asn)/Glu-tRNA(Gln) amidotransferase GatCAB subunit C [Hyphomicrobiales bacterium]|nr:MAG: Asp-tRNA(Asn)/Glu-tRNA(Gln) amidotransferase GatCAB subunit C [Hyphomicrobiales bacterium]